MKRSWLARHPIGFMALYTIFYLSVFHSLEANVPLRSILVHCRLDDLIPFCKYAVIPYFAWFLWIPFTLFYLLWAAPRSRPVQWSCRRTAAGTAARSPHAGPSTADRTG